MVVGWFDVWVWVYLSSDSVCLSVCLSVGDNDCKVQSFAVAYAVQVV